MDLVLIPILTITYGLQFCGSDYFPFCFLAEKADSKSDSRLDVAPLLNLADDKAVLGGASVLGIIEDLELSQVGAGGVVSTIRYSTATAAFYWGYAIAVLPISLLLQLVPLGKATACAVFLWGVIVFLTCACTNYEGLVAQRFFLGLVEATVSPAFVAISTTFYTKAEYGARIGFWYSATGIFSMFSGALNYAFGSVSTNIPTWKVLYIFAGSWTVTWALVILLIVPDSIDKATRWFSASERAWLQQRTVTSKQGVDDRTLRKGLLLEAFRDPLMYIYMVMGALIYICNGGVTAFGARIIRTFGYTSLQAILLQIPGGAATCVGIAVCVIIDRRVKYATCYLLAASCMPVIVGSVIIWQVDWSQRGVAIFGYTLIPVFGAPYVMLLTLAARNTAGGAKKAAANGFIFIGYTIGNIIGPYTVLTPEAPQKYRTTWITLICAMCAVIAMSLSLRAYFAWENKRRDRVYGADAPISGSDDKDAAAGTPLETLPAVSDEVSYLSDRQDTRFRYSY